MRNGAETQETIETEARDNPRPGVREPYKATRDGQSREIGTGLLRVSSRLDFESPDRSPRTTEAHATYNCG